MVSRMDDQMIHLWATRDGRHCDITREADGPPFEVIVWYRGATVDRRTFDTHREAAEFAIAQMNIYLTPDTTASSTSDRSGDS
jgi:hypothetical protein